MILMILAQKAAYIHSEVSDFNFSTQFNLQFYSLAVAF